MNPSVAPAWAEELKQAYLSGSSSLFLLHGNVADLVGSDTPEGTVHEPIADFLARRMFGGYDLVLHYDMGRGLRAFTGGDAARLTRMNAALGRLLGSEAELPRDPTQALRVLDRFVSLLLVGEENQSRKAAVLIDYAELLCPADDRLGEHLALLLNWARSPVIRRVNLLFVLMTESLGTLHPGLVQSGHTQEIFVPLPDATERGAFIAGRFPEMRPESDRLSKLTSGLTLANLDSMMRRVTREAAASTPSVAAPGPPAAEASPAGAKAATKAGAISTLGDSRLLALKKTLMEAQCPGLIEFIKPNYTLSMVAGHTAAKDRLRNDAELLKQGHLDVVPMGYLLCGPVGVGKTFLALCYAGEVGIPCLSIRNFRSKYVGDTEANLERILSVVRELGPVAVIIDEADAAVGNRSASGDSGTSARVFAQLASQMGDTRYRGRIVWFLLTCRPDLLPVDLKRQGRCEEHIPLFYPQTPGELGEMFQSMADKAGIELDPGVLPDFTSMSSLSGADIEGILTRARRESLLRNQAIDRGLLLEVIKTFRSVKSAEHELQWLAGILECTDLRYLPESVRAEIQKPGGQDALVRRYHSLNAAGLSSD